MFKLAKIGVLQSIFLYLKDDVPLCLSCMFGKERRREWRKKGKESRSIRKYTDNKPADGVSVDQLQSDQPVLGPKLLDKLTSARIWIS